MIELLLEQAKSGDVQAFVVALHHRGGACSTWQSGKSKISTMVYMLERAKLRVMGFVEDIDIDLDLSGSE